MDLKELGQLLRIRREEMGISISDISESTRISRSVLTVFELGDVDEYPHPVYAKGFIRNYARALGIDPEECVQVLERELGLRRPAAKSSRGVPADSREAESAPPLVKGGSPWLVLLGVTLLVGVLAALIWYFSFYSGKDMSDAAQGEPVAEAAAPALPVQQAMVEEAVQPEPSQPVAVADSQDAAADGTAVDGEVDGGAADAEASGQPLSAGASATGPAVAGAAGRMEPAGGDAVGVHRLTIEVIGQESCWVGVWIPDQEEIAKDFTVLPGESVTYRFSGKRDIRFGRMETVRLTLDGAALKTEGKGVVNLSLP